MHPIVALLAGLGGTVMLTRAFSKLFGEPKIFISYYYQKDRSLKRLLKAWSNNKKFKLSFEDTSADIFLKTSSDYDLKRELTKRIKKSDLVLVLIGKDTHSRKWVNYEISEAVRLKKPIVAVKQKKNQLSPTELKGAGAKWVYRFRAKPIIEAIEEKMP